MYVYLYSKESGKNTWQIICCIRHIHIRELLLNKKSLDDNFEKKKTRQKRQIHISNQIKYHVYKEKSKIIYYILYDVVLL